MAPLKGGGQRGEEAKFRSASGDRVYAGNFNANGLNVNDNNDDNRNDNLGRAVVRNFYLLFFIFA